MFFNFRHYFEFWMILMCTKVCCFGLCSFEYLYQKSALQYDVDVVS